MAILIVMIASGLGSVFAGGSSRADSQPGLQVSPKMQPPVQKAAANTRKSVRPSGWSGVTKLPGSDGSGSVASAQSTPKAAATTAIPLGSGSSMALGRSLNAVQFGDEHWPALQALWTRESNWNPAARNRSSGACGIPQALPCSKIKDMSPQGQIEWGLNYIQQRYGTPTKAWQFWLAHHWY
ncbi:hypothetical protein EPO04_00175 [Patescibacteria group bacterium]|nr:MAG: hypothetical protein EPO04_00175 [Patescibacteria group bacterium]